MEFSGPFHPLCVRLAMQRTSGAFQWASAIGKSFLALIYFTTHSKNIHRPRNLSAIEMETNTAWDRFGLNRLRKKGLGYTVVGGVYSVGIVYRLYLENQHKDLADAKKKK